MCLAYEYSLHPLTVDKSNWKELLKGLFEVLHQWFPLGMHLGLSHYELQDFEIRFNRQVLQCMAYMLFKWLQGPIEKRNKQYLQDALKQLNPQLVSLVYPPSTSGE